ncbi:MAG: HTTM domain-containing protein [Bacteroidota bacterium]
MDSWIRYINKHTEAAPLAVFRIFFGLMMFGSIVRFWANGWIDKLYIQPQFFFSYWGLDFIRPIGEYTYGIFLICGLSALMVMMGYKYRLAIITFFLSFTYIELMDKTTYLNHYYFISVLSFVLIFLPAHAYYSVDAWQDPSKRFECVPTWSIHALRTLMFIVYFYAGLAKLNSDWLLEAMPLKIWLPSKYDLPLLGGLLQKEWMHYFFSWAGAIYDLTIPFFLLYKPTRWIAFGFVVIFHVLTRVLFPIGMFPYIMIVSALIFFDADVHKKILEFIQRLTRVKLDIFHNGRTWTFASIRSQKMVIAILSVFFVAQLTLPFRYTLYPQELFWAEEGYRFSWRVMLMEKAGYANFKVVDPETGRRMYVENGRFLTPFQEKQMSTQPDFILEYAHFLEKHYQTEGIRDPEIYVESFVALNGRRSQPFIDPSVDLTKIYPSIRSRDWILPFKDDIKGL